MALRNADEAGDDDQVPTGAPVPCERHCPEQTGLYRRARHHAASFVAHAESSVGAELPQLFKADLDTFVECGMLPHGFLS